MYIRTLIASLVGFLLFHGTYAQEQDPVDWVEVDTKYLEDQFYIGLGYNLLLNKPDLLSQRNLSYGLQLGFIKDLPLNPERNFGLGVGVGYAVNSYYSNIDRKSVV